MKKKKKEIMIAISFFYLILLFLLLKYLTFKYYKNDVWRKSEAWKFSSAGNAEIFILSVSNW